MSEQYARTEDLRAIDVYPNVFPSIIDRDHGTYFLQEQGNALVNTEKHLVEKQYYRPSTLGISRGRSNPNQYLIKEDSFTDVGGGYATFIKHYAQIPEPWFDFEEKSVLVYQQGGSMGINYDSFYGTNGFGSYGFGFSSSTRENINYLAKATRYYVTKTTLDFYQLLKYSLQDGWAGSGSLSGTSTVISYLGVIIRFTSGSSFSGSFMRPNMIDDNVFLVNASTQQPYPAKLFLNAPLGTISKSDSRECVVAPDRVRLWQPNIYEITRYTSSINLLTKDQQERIPVQAYWQIPLSLSITSEELEGLQVDLFETRENVNPLTYYLYEDLISDDEKNSPQEIKIKVTSADNLFKVDLSSINVSGGNLVSTPSENFTEDSIFVQWNGSVDQVIVGFDVTR